MTPDFATGNRVSVTSDFATGNRVRLKSWVTKMHLSSLGIRVDDLSSGYVVLVPDVLSSPYNGKVVKVRELGPHQFQWIIKRCYLESM